MNYTCRGKIVTGANRVETLNERAKALRSQAADLREDLRGPINDKIKELDAQIKIVEKTPDLSVRAGCGYDMTDIINAIPADGDEYTYTCPKCGNTGTVRKLPDIKESA